MCLIHINSGRKGQSTTLTIDHECMNINYLYFYKPHMLDIEYTINQ